MHTLWHALVAAGVTVARQPQRSGDWGPFLARLGFRFVARDSFCGYAASAGDIAVLDSPRAGASGHVQGYDGGAWVGKCVQAGFWPTTAYRRAEPCFEIYRHRPRG